MPYTLTGGEGQYWPAQTQYEYLSKPTITKSFFTEFPGEATVDVIAWNWEIISKKTQHVHFLVQHAGIANRHVRNNLRLSIFYKRTEFTRIIIKRDTKSPVAIFRTVNNLAINRPLYTQHIKKWNDTLPIIFVHCQKSTQIHKNAKYDKRIHAKQIAAALSHQLSRQQNIILHPAHFCTEMVAAVTS